MSTLGRIHSYSSEGKTRSQGFKMIPNELEPNSIPTRKADVLGPGLAEKMSHIARIKSLQLYNDSELHEYNLHCLISIFQSSIFQTHTHTIQ